MSVSRVCLECVPDHPQTRRSECAGGVCPPFRAAHTGTLPVCPLGTAHEAGQCAGWSQDTLNGPGHARGHPGGSEFLPVGAVDRVRTHFFTSAKWAFPDMVILGKCAR